MYAKQNGETVKQAAATLDAVRDRLTEEEYSALKKGLDLARELAPTPDRDTDGRIAGAVMEDFVNNFSARTEDFVRDVVFHWHRALQKTFFNDIVRPLVKTYAGLPPRCYDERNESVVNQCRRLVEDEPLIFDFVRSHAPEG